MVFCTKCSVIKEIIIDNPHAEDRFIKTERPPGAILWIFAKEPAPKTIKKINISVCYILTYFYKVKTVQT